MRRRVQQDTTGHRGRTGDPLYPGPQSYARLTHAGSPHVKRNASVRPSWQMKHTSSVEVAYLHRASARGLPSSHTRPRPTPGRTPHPAPTSLSHPRNRSPRGGPYASGRTHSTPTSTQPEQATHPTEAINRHYRTRQTHRQRLPQPHQLQTPNAPHRRRPRCLHPHSTLKSRLPSNSSSLRRASLNGTATCIDERTEQSLTHTSSSFRDHNL